MPRYVCFLRGINLGNRRIKMDALRGQFETLKFSGVSTFIASGNVIFDTPASDPASLETKIERHLEKSLGYTVDTMIRTPADLAAVIAHQPFPSAELEGDGPSALHVMFLKSPLKDESVEKVLALQTTTDFFHVHERELYWLCRGSVARPSFSNALFAKAVSVPGTMRNLTTVGKLVALYPAPQ